MNNIRRAENEDIPGILKLLVQVDMVHHTGRPDLFKGPATKYDRKELERIVKDDQNPVFVYLDKEGQVVGHAFCQHKQILGDSVMTDVKTLYVDDICVDETCRGKGVGKALYAYVIAYAKEHGFYNVTLNVWECNPGAIKFYQSLGMKPQKIGMEQILPNAIEK
ncbi:MAG: GNAT family N-acetyltransferase [Lachnospiraceae bacterium]|nr:GNAT family N-acetyltransferase [Lachnospiraceae bacterium]